MGGALFERGYYIWGGCFNWEGVLPMRGFGRNQIGGSRGCGRFGQSEKRTRTKRNGQNVAGRGGRGGGAAADLGVAEPGPSELPDLLGLGRGDGAMGARGIHILGFDRRPTEGGSLFGFGASKNFGILSGELLCKKIIICSHMKYEITDC